VNLEFNETMAKTAFLDPRFIERAFSFESALQKIKKKNKIEDEMIYLINKERKHNEASASTSGFSRSKGDTLMHLTMIIVRTKI
jgi:hypothetical protein